MYGKKWYRVQVVKRHPVTPAEFEEYEQLKEFLEEFFYRIGYTEHGGSEARWTAKSCFSDEGHDDLFTEKRLQSLIDKGLYVEFLPDKQKKWIQANLKNKVDEINRFLKHPIVVDVGDIIDPVGFEDEECEEEIQKYLTKKIKTGWDTRIK